MEQIIQLNSNAKLSEHFTLGEMTRSSHPEVYNIPSHEAIENLKRLCGWLEVLRKRYNELNQTTPGPQVLPSSWEEGPGVEEKSSSTYLKEDETVLNQTTPGPSLIFKEGNTEGIIINSGYRSPQLNRKIGGAANSNHLTGCAVDIRVSGMEQLIQYAAILIQYAKETHQDFDELLLERNKHGAIWLHFAVRPKDNRRKTLFLSV